VSCETEDRHRHEWTNVFTEENAEKAAAGDKLAQERVIQELSEEKRPNREVNRRWMEEEEARMQEGANSSYATQLSEILHGAMLLAQIATMRRFLCFK
jgi:hypothetical protein